MEGSAASITTLCNCRDRVVTSFNRFDRKAIDNPIGIDVARIRFKQIDT